MTNFNIKHLFLTIIVYLVVDIPWLAFGAKALNADYNTQIAKIQGSPMKAKPNAALVTYIMIALCIYYFGIRDNLNSSLKNKLIDAVMIALAIYGSFDLINYTLFDKLPLRVVIIDILWGIVSVSLTILITTYLIKKRI